MSDVKFKFSNDKQRNLNFGKQINPIEENIRKEGRHIITVKMNVTKLQLRKIFDAPMGINYATFPLKDIYGRIMSPKSPEYKKQKPIRVSFICSENHPNPLARYTREELYKYLVKRYDKLILEWELTEKDEKGIKDLLFTHTGLLEQNELTHKEKLNKNAFNVRLKPVYQHEMEYHNRKMETMGFKLKISEALLSTEKTILKPKRFFYEVGDF